MLGTRSGHALDRPRRRERARRRDPKPASDAIAMEAAVSLSYNGLSHVVMMMTPADLEDFALGFSLSEGIVERPAQIYDIVRPRRMRRVSRSRSPSVTSASSS